MTGAPDTSGSAGNARLEDKIQCELQQRASGSRFFEGGPHVELERVMIDLYNHLAWRMFDCEPAKPWEVHLSG